MKASEWVGRWAGRTVVCLASGPSLTPDDCNLVRLSGHPTIVTNTTFRLAPWADVLFGFDSKWWKEYGNEVAGVFKGDRVTCSVVGHSLGIATMHQQHWFRHFNNSGASAISLAIIGGAKRVILLGYDCQKTDGKTHWHGDHPRALGNAHSLPNWPRFFANVAKYAKTVDIPVLNCSRATALACFPRVELENVI